MSLYNLMRYFRGLPASLKKHRRGITDSRYIKGFLWT